MSSAMKLVASQSDGRDSMKVYCIVEEQESGYVGPCTVHVAASREAADLWLSSIAEYRRSDFEIREFEVRTFEELREKAT
jgi:hypothetical protein